MSRGGIGDGVRRLLVSIASWEVPMARRAALKLTPCLAKFRAAFSSSHRARPALFRQTGSVLNY